MKKFYLLCFMAFLSVSMVFPQVGINTDDPSNLSSLDVYPRKDAVGAEVPQGIFVPRLTQDQRDAIDVSNPDIANGLFIYNTDEDCFNYYSRTESIWKSMCGGLGRAVISEVDCDATMITGNDYRVGKPLDSGNVLQITLSVERAGTYDISAVARVPNGYSFTTSGTFMSPGTIYLLTIPGYGTPLNEGTDEIIITVNGKQYCPGKTIDIASSVAIPDFTVDCNSKTVSGRYIYGTATNSTSDRITIMANVTGTSNGETEGVVELETDEVNGLKFSGSATFGAIPSNVAVTLYATGTPTSWGTYTLPLKDVKKNQYLCDITLQVAARTMNIYGLGENNTYYINASSNGMYRVLNNTSVFGTAQDALVPVAGINISGPGTGNGHNVSTTLSGNTSIDILIVQYNWFGDGGARVANQNAIIDFVKNKGGVAILCSDGGTRGEGIAAIFGGVTGITPTCTSVGDGSGWMRLSDSPIFQNGPYNIANLAVGRDNGSNFRFDNYSGLEVLVYDGQTASSSARSIRSTTWGLMGFGDGAPFAYASSTNNEPYNYPMKLDASNSPRTGTTNGTATYNAHFFVDIMNWAINHVMTYRADPANPIPPTN